MKKYLSSSIKYRLLIGILIGIIPTVIFILLVLNYLVYISRQHAKEILSYKSYFSREVTKEIFQSYTKEMFLLAHNKLQYEDEQAISLAYALMDESNMISGILIFTEKDKLIMSDHNDQISEVFNEGFTPNSMEIIREQLGRYTLSIGASINILEREYLPLMLTYWQPMSLKKSRVIFLVDWLAFIDRITLKNGYEILGSTHWYKQTFYSVKHFSYQNEQTKILAQSFLNKHKVHLSQPSFSIYQTTVDGRHNYMSRDEILYHRGDNYFVLTVSQIDYPWYYHIWQVLSIAIILVVLITVISSFIGYLILKLVMLRDIESILTVVNEVGKGNFVARARVHSEKSLGLLATGINIMVEKIAQKTYSLMEDAHTDELTGIYNRRYFFNRSQAVMDSKQPNSVILFDIDNFKKFNDKYGHNIGDLVLVHVAELIDTNIRKSDIFARYGGEEFIILLRDTTEEVALRIAEHLRYIVFSSYFDTKTQGSVRISISLGIATANANEPSNLEALVEHADMALYQAKENGRNKGVLFGNFREQKISSVLKSSLNIEKNHF